MCLLSPVPSLNRENFTPRVYAVATTATIIAVYKILSN
jgi:hypothetical protein